MAQIRVIKCLCHGVKFSKLKTLAQQYNVTSLEELRRYALFGTNCKRCIPYVLETLKSGKTEFYELLEEPGDKTDPSNDKSRFDEL